MKLSHNFPLKVLLCLNKNSSDHSCALYLISLGVVPNMQLSANQKLSYSTRLFTKVRWDCIISLGVYYLVGCFGVYRPFETVFQSISGRLPKRGRERKERIDESKNVQTTPTRTYCQCSRPLPYCNPNSRTPRHWKFTQHHRTTRPPPGVY